MRFTWTNRLLAEIKAASIIEQLGNPTQADIRNICIVQAERYGKNADALTSKQIDLFVKDVNCRLRIKR